MTITPRMNPMSSHVSRRVRSARRFALVATTLALLAFAASCGDDTPDTPAAPAPTTAAQAGGGPSTSESVGAPTTSVTGGSESTPTTSASTDTSSDTTVPFDQGVDALEQQLVAAGTDRCAVRKVYLGGTSNIADPQGGDEIRRAVKVASTLFRAVADVIDDDNADAAAKLRSAIDKFNEQLEAANYSTEVFQSFGNDPDLSTGIRAFLDQTKDCPG